MHDAFDKEAMWYQCPKAGTARISNLPCCLWLDNLAVMQVRVIASTKRRLCHGEADLAANLRPNLEIFQQNAIRCLASDQTVSECRAYYHRRSTSGGHLALSSIIKYTNLSNRLLYKLHELVGRGEQEERGSNLRVMMTRDMLDANGVSSTHMCVRRVCRHL